MLKKPKSKQKTVAEKVAELIVRPNQHGSDSDSEDEATAPQVIDFDEDEYQMPEAGTTEFRKRNVKLLSEQSSKYKGKITSRKDFEEDSNDDDNDDDEEEEDSDDGDEYEHSDEEENPAEDTKRENDYDSDANDEAFKKFSNILDVTQNGTLGDTESEPDDVSGSSEKSEMNSYSETEVEAFEAFDKIWEDTKKGIVRNMESDTDEENTSNEKSDNDSDTEADVDSHNNEDDNSLTDENDSAENGDNDTDNEDDNSLAEDNDNEGDNDETEVISKINQHAEIQKGTSVQCQLRLWERLLELRINTQKFLSKANQLPACNDELKDVVTANAKHKAVLEETSSKTQNLLCHLVSLQNSLYSGFPEIKKTMKKCLKRSIPFKDTQCGEPALKQMNLYLQDRFDTFTPYRNEVLLKWDDRTKLLTPGAGAKKKPMDEDYDIIKKINNVLLNKSMLIQKSQQLKNAQVAKRHINDAENDEEEREAALVNCNIYDDSDFYHQQLRELIEHKANESSNMSEITKQFVELQKLRQKMKKKVDTRASKGRKMRYVVHNKLINFMAPQDITTWTDESKEELCKSLFV